MLFDMIWTLKLDITRGTTRMSFAADELEERHAVF